MSDLLRVIEVLRHPTAGTIRLSDRQRAIMREALSRTTEGEWRYKTVFLCWPKGSGKTLMVAALLVAILLTRRHSRSVILGPTERQGKSVLLEAVRDILRCSVPDVDPAKTVIDCVRTGAQILVVPCSERTVQGIRPRAGGVVAIDEAHEFPADPEGRLDSEVGGALQLLLSQAEDPTCQAWLIGVLGQRDGYTHYMRDLCAGGEAQHVFFSYETSRLPSIRP